MVQKLQRVQKVHESLRDFVEVANDAPVASAASFSALQFEYAIHDYNYLSVHLVDVQTLRYTHCHTQDCCVIAIPTYM
jgi:hypothetical protein